MGLQATKSGIKQHMVIITQTLLYFERIVLNTNAGLTLKSKQKQTFQVHLHRVILSCYSVLFVERLKYLCRLYLL